MIIITPAEHVQMLDRWVATVLKGFEEIDSVVSKGFIIAVHNQCVHVLAFDPAAVAGKSRRQRDAHGCFSRWSAC